MFSNFFFFQKSCRLWDNVEKYGRARQATDGNIIRRMRFACWVTKATDTHSEYVILTVFQRQPWLLERASVLNVYVYIAFPVKRRKEEEESERAWSFAPYGRFLASCNGEEC
jgi:hypothetical protein